jgi:hypothetical protein
MDEQGLPVGDTTDWPGIILMIILIAVVAQCVVGMLLWRYAAVLERRRVARICSDVAARIFDKIDKQLQEALKATGGSTQSQLQLLIDVIAATLGKTLAVGGGLGKQIEGMRKALSTKVKEPAKSDHGHGGPGTALIVRRPGPSAGLSLVSQGAPTTASASAAAGAASVSVTTTPSPITTLPYPGSSDIIVDPAGQVIEATSPSQVYFIGHDGASPVSHAPKPVEMVERDLTSEEVRVAARRAIEDFADYWTRETVERLLREAQIELTTLPVADAKEERAYRALTNTRATRSVTAPAGRAVGTSKSRKDATLQPVSGSDLASSLTPASLAQNASPSAEPA